MTADWQWGLNQGNAIENGRLNRELNRANEEVEGLGEIGVGLAKMLGEARQAQQSFQEWQNQKHENPTASEFDIASIVNPQNFQDSPIEEKRLINLRLQAWAEYYQCKKQDSKYIKENDAPVLKGLSDAMMKTTTISEVRNAAAAIADVANRLELAGDEAFEDSHQWVKDRVADMQTTVKWKSDDPTIPDPTTLDGQRGKPITIQDIERKYRAEGQPDFVADMIGLNISGVGDMALR